MKAVLWCSSDRSILRLVRGFNCGGIPAAAVRSVPIRVRGVAERHFVRGTIYD